MTSEIVVLRWIDAFVFSLAATLAVVFARYVFLNICKAWHEPWLNAGIGLMVYFSGHAIVRGWVWIIAQDNETGNRSGHLAGIVIGSAIMAAGALCIVRVFLTATYGRWTWQVVGLSAALIAVIMAQF